MKSVLVAAAAITFVSAGAGSAWAQSSDDWAGVSVGVVGGAVDTIDDDVEAVRFDRDLNGEFNDSVTTVAGADAFSPGFCGGSANGASVGQGCDKDKAGVEAAARVGYDFQYGQLVVGGVVEVGGVESEDSVTAFSTTPANYTFKRSLHTLAAARLRLGIAAGDALFYGTGGYAHGKVDNRFFSSNAVNLFTTNSPDEEGLDGWQVGGGIEYRLAPGLTLIGEYIYTRLEEDDPFTVRVGRGAAPATNPFILPPNTAGTDLIRTSDAFETQSFRIGMAYRY